MRAMLAVTVILAAALVTGVFGGAAAHAGWHHGHFHGGGVYRGYGYGWHGPARGYYTPHRAYYGGYRHFGYGVGYRPYAYGYRNYVNYYRPNFYRPYAYPYYRPVISYRAFAPAFFPPVYNYAPAYYSDPCYPTYQYDGFFGVNNTYGTSTPPQYATSELPYGFDGVRPFVDTVRTNVGNNPAQATIVAQLLQRLAANRAASQSSAPAMTVAAERVAFSPTVAPPLARQRAREMISLGDRYFREQKYYDASRKYREAAVAAPDLAEAHFRNGHALTAMNRLEPAAEAFRKALDLNPNIARDGFKLDDLYGDAGIAKTSHIESLAAAALADPSKSDTLLLMGMLLHYDGEAERAEKFFRRCGQLEPQNKSLAIFVPELAAPRELPVRQDEI